MALQSFCQAIFAASRGAEKKKGRYRNRSGATRERLALCGLPIVPNAAADAARRMGVVNKQCVRGAVPCGAAVSSFLRALAAAEDWPEMAD